MLTRQERDSNTVDFFPSNSEIPFLSSDGLVAYAVIDLIAALKNPNSSKPLFLGDDQLCALTKLADIFASVVTPKHAPSNIASPRVGNNRPIQIPAKPRVPTNNDIQSNQTKE